MSGYEVEHNISSNEGQSTQPARRPDLSTFFSTLEQVDTSGEHMQHNNVHALPLPGDVAAAFRNLANAFEMMRGGEAREGGQADDLLGQLVESLMTSANDPPQEVKGVPDTFLEDLDRVPKSKLKDGESCPICGIPFLDDKYPLVVTLPCHKDHKFDLECIRPWLKLNPTCPLDRKVIWKKKAPPPPPEDDDEEDYDDMYA